MEMEVTQLPLPLMQRRRTVVVREIKTMKERGPKEEREDVTLVTRLVTVAIKGTTGSKEKRKAPSDRSGNGQPFKRSRNAR